MTEKFDLNKLKELYAPLQVKYNLPEFSKLNEEFGVEKAADEETEFVLREIRKYVADKFLDYFRFIESILNPVNTPSIFIFSLTKTLSTKDREKIVEIYKKMAKVELNLMELDVEYSEEKEAEFIKESYTLWQDIKKDIKTVIDVIKKNWDNKLEENNKGYFG
ncbi:MAG: hypothetical protein NTU63_03345 [Candidatus Pacearchaeota archaeon]|nr:hypothetical protein [Candidatus Pacearchaeota archaeon]